MKKVLAILLALAMVFAFAACGEEKESDKDKKDETVYKIGMVCIGDETQAYDQNFYKAADAAKAQLASEGINIEWVYTYKHVEGEPVAEDNETLAEEGCLVIFNNSYGQEPAMLQVAPLYENVTFVSCTNEVSSRDFLDNTINAFPDIYEARYLAGIAAGMKLNELIEKGEITADEARLGYVGAYTFAEVISGYTAFFLGARSVCPSATMYVNFIGDWGDYGLEKDAATLLIEDYQCKVISQHSDQVSPAVVAQEKGVYHVGYNIAMSGDDIAPNASIISSRIDWTNFFVKVIKTAVAGEKQDQDYLGYGLKTGDVALTELNTKIAADGTAEAIEAARAKIESGELHIFDTSTFTYEGGKTLETFLVDMTGDFVGDEGYEAVFDGYFHESYFKSAPAFGVQIDGITLTNVAY